MNAHLEDAALDAALRQSFGFTAFRAGQREVIRTVLQGRPALAVMPTGAGKSLCYQLPALLLPGVTLVVSPLIALMRDQVDGLRARGLPATLINSSLSERERLERANAMTRGDYKLVYVAPERFRSPRFLEVLRRTPIALLAVDEAHCISQWGHDFRPDYARLGEVRALLGSPRTLALTATATPEVRRDICRVLRLANPAQFISGFDRPNLFLEVVRAGRERDKVERTAAVAARGGSGIVYTATRKFAERMAGELAARGLEVVCYHAGLSDPERRHAQDAFMSSRSAVAVATNAFGMGVDKADIRFVVHADIPKSIEAYYQEIGRAGRDGQPALAMLLFGYADVIKQERLIRGSHPDATLVRDVWDAVRRDAAELSPASLAAALGSREHLVGAALRLLEAAGHLERTGPNDATLRIELLRPATSVSLHERAQNQRAALLAVAGRAAGGSAFEVRVPELAERANLPADALRRALAALADAGVLEVTSGAPRGMRVLEPDLAPDGLRVDMRLVRWQEQRDLALLKQMAAYAGARTCRRAYLLRYFGERSQARRCASCDVCSGGTVVAVRGDARGRGAATRRLPLKEAETRELTWSLYASGLGLEDIARRRGLSDETIRNHLADLLEAGRTVELARLIPRERAEAIVDAARDAAPFLPAVKRALPPDYLFGEVRLVLAARKLGRSAGEAADAPPQQHQREADDHRLQEDRGQRDGREQHAVPERREAAERDRGEVLLEEAEPAQGQERQAVQVLLQLRPRRDLEAAQQLRPEAEPQVRHAQAPRLVEDDSGESLPGEPRLG